MSMLEARRQFLDQRRDVCRERFDTLHAPGYDDAWGALPDSHRRWLGEIAVRLGSGATVLDAACGTGRAWPPLLEAGIAVTGVDQSQGMLDVAAGKHPEVSVRRAGLQDLAGLAQFRASFDGLTCLDAMECIGPEDWPVVVAGFGAVLRPGGAAYITVEIPGAEETAAMDAPAADGSPLVAGELYDGIGYHYYPADRDVLGWLGDAGFEVIGEQKADYYWHLMLRLSPAGSSRADS